MPKWQFSPAFIYNQINGGVDKGSTIERALRLLEASGCATMADMPYTDKNFTQAPPTAAVDHAAKYKPRVVASLFQKTPDPDTLASFLAQAQVPFAMAIPIYEDFPDGKVTPDYVYSSAGTGKLEGYHAITIVGYDDNLRAFRLVNSWGPEWGDQGFLWLSYDFVKAKAFDAWTVKSAGGGRVKFGPGAKPKFPETQDFDLTYYDN